jgi:hypothetical protein
MEEYKQANTWQYLWKLLDVQEYRLSNRQENLELVIYSVFSFAVPLLLKQPQFLVGSFVNMMLILAALNLRGKKLIPVIVMPSLGVAAGGYLFGGITASFIYLIPFIWIGNAIIVLIFKQLMLSMKQNFLITLGIGSAAKAGLLFGITSLFVALSIIPAAFLAAMGLLQLTTVITGGACAFAMQKAKNASS